ncbi:hypothetical protein G6F28_012355 [Rhizopus arrhizus]|nr:hypothetical protein G6F28_012355 [Rhizopus arrhizus]
MSNRSPKDIVGEFGIHPKTVRRYRNKLFGPMVPATRGRHILVSSATKEYIEVLLIKGALKIAKDAHRMLMRFGYSISYRSAINVLVSMIFYARRKKRQPLSTYNHRKQRLAWAKKYQSWSIQQWHQVVFSDETKINIWGSDGCRYYWTQPGDVLRPHHIDLSVKHGSGKLTMCGCITTTYMETLKYYGMNKRTSYLQQDNDPKHKSKSTMSWFQQNKVRYINDWPPNSPDLNPIQHVWHLLKLRLSLYERKARNIDELWERVDVEWNKLDKDVCRSYIDSMPDRIAAVIKSKGRFTRY